VFVSYVLKSMRQSLNKEDAMFGEGFGADMMDGLFEAELGGHVSRSSSLGLAEMLYKKITGEEYPRTVASPGDAAGSEVVPGLPRGTVFDPLRRRSDAEKDSPGAQKVFPPGQGSVAAVPDSVRRRIAAYAPHISEAAERHGVDANLIRAVIATESGGHPDAQSPRHAKGLMQLIDSTATSVGVGNVWDPRENILGGARYLQQLMGRFGNDLTRVLASYNAGPSAVERYDGIPPYEETRSYVNKVLNYLRFFTQEGQDDGYPPG
jgi:Rod binding domain-containing protein